MPEVFRQHGFRFLYSGERDHPRSEGHLTSNVLALSKMHVAYNDGYDARTLRWLIEIITRNRTRIESFSNEYFG